MADPSDDEIIASLRRMREQEVRDKAREEAEKANRNEK